MNCDTDIKPSKLFTTDKLKEDKLSSDNISYNEEKCTEDI